MCVQKLTVKIEDKLIIRIRSNEIMQFHGFQAKLQNRGHHFLIEIENNCNDSIDSIEFFDIIAARSRFIRLHLLTINHFADDLLLLDHNSVIFSAML